MESEIVRWWHRQRRQFPSSAPFLSGDTFRTLAAHRYEKHARVQFDAKAVQPGDVVFCEGDVIREFFEGPGSGVVVPFVFMTHNDDTNIDESYFRYIDDRIIRWFCTNNVTAHSRLVPVPIGLENAKNHYYGIVRDFNILRQESRKKQNRILYNFAVVNNPTARQLAKTSLDRCSVAVQAPPTNPRKYRQMLSTFKFVASPPGHGEDCHRTWEALYLGVVPIVKRSVLTTAFKHLGLPIWEIETWHEVEQLTELDLEVKYNILLPEFNHEALWFDYWEQRIRSSTKTGQ